jgi:hypothetical protein
VCYLSRDVSGVNHLGFTVMFSSESKIVCVLLSKFWVIYVFSHGVRKLLTCFCNIRV